MIHTYGTEYIYAIMYNYISYNIMTSVLNSELLYACQEFLSVTWVQ